MRTGVDKIRMKTMLAPEGPAALTIGRSKTAEKTPNGVTFKAFDKPVFTIEGRRVTLDLCGHWTPATVRAMREYAEALGLDIKPSLAKGKFTASYKGTIHEAGYDNKITIEV